MAYKRLGDVLLAAGVITEEQLHEALQKQKSSDKRLGELLIEDKFISEQELIHALEDQLGVDFIDLTKQVIPENLASLVPKTVAKQYNVVPVNLDRDGLYLAMVDPLNFMAVEEVKKISKKNVIPMISTQESVDRAIIMLYGNEGAAKAIEEMRRDTDEGEDKKKVAETLDDDKNSAPTVRLVNSVLERAVTERASDIHLEPEEYYMRVRMRIDGVLRSVLEVPKELEPSVISRLKVMGNMNTSERRIPQDGRANIRVQNKDIDLRISTLPTVYGEKMVIRLLDKGATNHSTAGIGLDDYNLKRYEKMLRNNNGVFLICGPTGSGKSTTMSTMVRQLNNESVNVVTLEDPVEYNIEGVNQVQINEKTNMTFASGLRSILRQDPDIISVGEIRDGETAEIAMRAAITGHLVLSTIHTNDAIATIDRLYDIGVEPYLTVTALRGVIAQRLVRRICPNCREAFTPDKEQLEMLGLEPQKGMKFYRGKGCPMCSHTGYKGRTGVFEILLINKAVRKAIVDRASHDEILEIAREDGYKTMTERCIEMILDGTTTFEEAIRTIITTGEE